MCGLGTRNGRIANNAAAAAPRNNNFANRIPLLNPSAETEIARTFRQVQVPLGARARDC